MCLINVAHEHLTTQTGKKSKPALVNVMGPGAEKNKYPVNQGYGLSVGYFINLKFTPVLLVDALNSIKEISRLMLLSKGMSFKFTTAKNQHFKTSTYYA